MDFIETKAHLINNFGHLEQVRGIGVLGKGKLAIFLQKDYKEEDLPKLPEYKDFTVFVLDFETSQKRLEQLQKSYEEYKKSQKNH